MYQRFLYVIAASSAGPCKLGTSAKPEQRLRQLQTGHAERLQVFHLEAVEADRAALLERLLHRDIGHHRCFGEWFRLPVAEAIGYIRYVIITYALVENLRDCLHPRR
jgi:hypothetical protein